MGEFRRNLSGKAELMRIENQISVERTNCGCTKIVEGNSSKHVLERARVVLERARVVFVSLGYLRPQRLVNLCTTVSLSLGKQTL